MRPTRAFSTLALLAALAFPGSAQQPPAIVALTLDTSGSIRPELLEQTRVLATAILEALPPGSEVALFTFDDASRVILERTRDPEAVRQALAGVSRAGRYTALYDAIYDASRYLNEAPPSRKAIVLVTDGKDENSALQAEDGLKLAVDGRIPIYAVGIGRVQDAVMRRIAKLTSGEFGLMEETDGASLAQQIAALEPVGLATPAPPPVTRPPLSAPAAEPAAGGLLSNPLLLAGGLLLIVGGAAAAIALRSKPAPVVKPGPGLSLPVPDGAGGESADSTVVMRSPEVGTVEKTVFLRVKPVLKVTSGPQSGKLFTLKMDSALSIGRAPTNDISLNDSSVSGEHCRVRPEEGAYVIHDLGSTNGTFVNDKRIEKHQLREGDIIRVGETRMTYGTE